jgi:alanine racemase
MVMNPEEQSMDLLLKYDLEPEIYNFRVLGLLEKAMTENLAESGNPISIHVKIDTGMHRLGFDPAEVDTLIARLKNNADIHVRSVFSHLAASEDPAEDEFTKTQIKLLGSVAGKIQAGLGYQALVHILNSAGISRFADPTQTMVRLGIGLYGIGFGEEEQQQLRNVSTLKTSISQIREVKAGETVGYNRKGVSKTGRIIAIIPIGYADGFNRKLGNGTGKVIIRGKPAVTVGNISMDSCAVDITDIVDPANPEPVREGEEVIIFGDAYPITLMARALDTIPYEILTGISQRVKRVYFYE